MIRVRTHGTLGPRVVVLHGGPAAVGEAAPIARALADRFRVLEPWQRGSGGAPLTVARHIEDLHELLSAQAGRERPGLIGESWGAMLALAYTAAYPTAAGPIVLVGCGTFDPAARARMRAILQERIDPDLRRRIAELPAQIRDPQQRLEREYELIRSLYDFDPLPEEPADHIAEPLDVVAHTETWEDMLRLQRQGVYPAAFSAIESPVLMLHGAHDPHPGQMIRDGLVPHLPQLEYREWEECGHSPWRERRVRDAFLAELRDWLGEHL